MFCANCGFTVLHEGNFCVQCGEGEFLSAYKCTQWTFNYFFPGKFSNHVHGGTGVGIGHSESSSDSEADGAELEASFDEEEVLKYYLNRSFNYQEILTFLSERHQHSLSYNTLLRRLKKYGLRR
ncbi:hypothetical protein P5673_021820 [Acropora cervicornis]|uniref:Uncharacterized protein n=1 Tax=Acropora cervicornis TaxID=6130 RepID=A0AAD9Q7L4_ACRCE|nr:hypothetical protein P5673_021820 [Acropora cervicornis]